MYALTTAFEDISRALQKRTRVHKYETVDVKLGKPLRLPEGQTTADIAALRIRAAWDDGRREIPQARIIDALHIALPQSLSRLGGWAGSPEKLVRGQETSFITEGIPDAAHEYGRLWDLTNADSFLSEQRARGPGIILAARSVREGPMPVFRIGDREMHFPLSLDKGDIARTMEVFRPQIQSVVDEHCRHPRGARIPADNMLYMRSDPVPYLRPYDNGDRPANVLEAVAPRDGVSPTKSTESRVTEQAVPRADGSVVINGKSERRIVRTGDMIGFAFPKLATLVRARIASIVQKRYRQLTHEDALDAGASGVAGLRDGFARLYNFAIPHEKMLALLKFEMLGKQRLPDVR